MRPLISAIFMGGVFALCSLLLVDSAALGVTLGALLVGTLSALMTMRAERGKPLLPTAGLIVLGLSGLALYGAALLTWDPPAGSTWIAVVLVFAFPIGVLLMAYRQWRTSR